MIYNYIENDLGVLEGVFAGLAISLAVIALIALIFGILVIVAKWQLLEKGNKPGGIIVISFSILVVIFSNIMMYIN